MSFGAFIDLCLSSPIVSLASLKLPSVHRLGLYLCLCLREEMPWDLWPDHDLTAGEEKVSTLSIEQLKISHWWFFHISTLNCVYLWTLQIAATFWQNYCIKKLNLLSTPARYKKQSWSHWEGFNQL